LTRCGAGVKICLVGAGAIGGWLGACLAQACPDAKRRRWPAAVQ